MGFSGFDYFNQGVVDKDVLLFGLHQMIPLTSNMLQETENVDVPAAFDLAHHRIQHDITSGSTHTGAEIIRLFILDNILKGSTIL